MVCETSKPLTKEQHERLENVLNLLKTNDHITLIAHKYFDEYNDEVDFNACCAVGLLAKQMDEEIAYKLLTYNDTAIEDFDPDVLDAFSRYYGLSKGQLIGLQEINDNNSSDIRKQEIIAYFEDILNNSCHKAG
ncbi:hypothetical protein [Parageobacillus galactosidasius]|uniref:Uncharacterized protein n=1 Tax=Parageobacillus galactosidasius TaxID=883812 RepID=A0A226QTU9_9BACL|nr:hypothetical protein [Parageobacillus galactosidasius]OXB94839.1 hypothetical protein B9L23_08230 [Parageobacillus galactosidasius]